MLSRRRALGAGSLGAAAGSAALLAACAPGLPSPAPLPAGGPPAPDSPLLPPEPTPEPAPRLIPTPPQPVALRRLAPGQIERIVQPIWSVDGSRVLFYDQPRAGQGGTWAIDPAATSAQRERAEWGSYFARAALLAVPDPAQRRTWVTHTGSGAEWLLPTTNPIFSNDAAVVAYGASGTLTVAAADDQGARRVALPLGGANVLGWMPGSDRSRTRNAALLLYGRQGDGYGLYSYGVNDRRLVQLAKARRIPGYLLSPDGAWLAHIGMWSGGASEAAENGLWLTRTDGALRRKVPFSGSARWTADNRLLVMPHRARPNDSHELWEANPARGTLRRLIGPEQTQFRVANCDWDLSPDGTQLVFVSAQDKGLWHLTVPQLAPHEGSPEGVVPPEVPPPSPNGTSGKPYRLPFESAPGVASWYVSQWYGVTVGGYRWRVSVYGEGQGIHFGVDFAAPLRTPVLAVAAGRVIAVDGDYGSPPHNVVLKLNDGNEAVYGHLAERSQHVKVGDVVAPGQVVGLSGDSVAPYDGLRNPHLHLEIRKQGRVVATNPTTYFDANWDDMSLGVWNGALFERDLDNPRRHQFLDEQPDIRFGGPILTNFARPWPVF
ncbi:MAG TPA: peptidoglycan DD-metalloendopeptidase family protein [Chloroflexota bacterium]|nr:peptidoglycan DD-metalloendopeptidase family protein [Chloroflexota bacterium]